MAFLTAIVWVACVGVSSSIRSTYVEGMDKEEVGVSVDAPTQQECQDYLLDAVKNVTYKDWLAPIIQGNWYISNPSDSKVVAEFVGSESSGKLGSMGTRRPETTWDLQRIHVPTSWTNLKAVMPTYSMKNSATKEYLTTGSSTEMDGLALSVDQIAIDIRFTARGLKIFIDGQESTYTLQPSSELGSPDADERANQMSYNPQLAVFSTGHHDFTWSRTRHFLGFKPGSEGKLYSLLRASLVETGKIAENENHVVIASALQAGICEMPPSSLTAILDSVVVMTEIQKMAERQKGCPSMRLFEFSQLFRGMVESACYDDCEAAMHDVLQEKNVACDETLNASTVAESIESHESCLKLPVYAQDELLDFTFQKTCLKWTPPSFLWTYNDREVKQQGSGHQVCGIHPMDAPFVKDRKFINQIGMCPEGTHCDCPDDATWTDHKLASEVRSGKYGSSLTIVGSLAAQNMYAGISAGVLTSLTTMPIWMSLWNMRFPTLKSFQAALGSGWWSRTMYGRVMAVRGSSLKFRCAQTVACWPILPERTKIEAVGRGSCRIPKSAYSGGSPVGFMPPPLLKATRQNFFLRTCVLKRCSESEIRTQKVGFSDDSKSMLNCQPLSWDDMSESQQELYKQQLTETGVLQEYELGEAMKIRG